MGQLAKQMSSTLATVYIGGLTYLYNCLMIVRGWHLLTTRQLTVDEPWNAIAI
jgi:hypothetical protein